MECKQIVCICFSRFKHVCSVKILVLAAIERAVEKRSCYTSERVRETCSTCIHGYSFSLYRGSLTWYRKKISLSYTFYNIGFHNWADYRGILKFIMKIGFWDGFCTQQWDLTNSVFGPKFASRACVLTCKDIYIDEDVAIRTIVMFFIITEVVPDF